MLHLANGDATAGNLRRARLPGDIESADDILMEGPARDRLARGAEWEARAAFLDTFLGIPSRVYLEGTERRHALFKRALGEDEAVLWFEEDLFCQVNYMQALSWFTEHGGPQARLSFVCPPRERLGVLQSARLAQLFDERRPVTQELLQTAEAAWLAFTSPDPLDLQALIDRSNFTGWPLLRDGLRAHLARFPYLHAGINRIEHSILRSLEAGSLAFGELFGRLSADVPKYGVGDLSVARYLLDLSAEPALLTIITDDGAPALSQYPRILNWRVTLTPLGAAVLRGDADYGPIAHFDRWLGGVHLHGSPAWRFDETQAALVRVKT